jgi:hypothetical protein
LDSITYKQWVREMLVLFLNEGYLLQDSFSVYAKEENVSEVQCTGVGVEFIPTGYTPCLQVFNRDIHRTLSTKHAQLAYTTTTTECHTQLDDCSELDQKLLGTCHCS